MIVQNEIPIDNKMGEIAMIFRKLAKAFVLYCILLSINQLILASESSIHLPSSDITVNKPFQIDFSKSTLEENCISIQGAGFGMYPIASLMLGTIPIDNSSPDVTDGLGAIIIAEPNQGIMIIGPIIDTACACFVRCSVQTNSSNVSVIIATIDQGPHVFVSTNTPNNGAYFVGTYHRIMTFYFPPSSGFQPVLQIVNTSPEEKITAYVDNFEIFPLASDRFYNGEFFNGNTVDPARISISMDDIPGIEPTPLATTPSTTPTLSFTPTHTLTPTLKPTPMAILPSKPILVYGLVYNDQNLPLRRADITIGEIKTITSIIGQYQVMLPRPGEYNVTVKAVGYPLFMTSINFSQSGAYNITLPKSFILTPTELPGQVTQVPTPTRTPTATPTFTPKPSFPAETDLLGKWVLKLTEGSSWYTSDTYLVTLSPNHVLTIDDPVMGLIQGTFSYNRATGDFYGKYSKTGIVTEIGRYKLVGEFIGKISMDQQLTGDLRTTQTALDYGITESGTAKFIGTKL